MLLVQKSLHLQPLTFRWHLPGFLECHWVCLAPHWHVRQLCTGKRMPVVELPGSPAPDAMSRWTQIKSVDRAGLV